MKVPYTILPPDVAKPLIPVRLGNPKNHRVLPNQVKALIDSGADVCFCTTDIADFLQIDLDPKKKEKFTAANDESFIGIKHVCNLHVLGKNYLCSIYFTDELPKHIPIILGQKGFFDHFIVSFNLRQKEIEIFL